MEMFPLLRNGKENNILNKQFKLLFKKGFFQKLN